MNYFEVSVAAKHTGRQFFTYSANANAAIGSIVEVPFGKNTAFGIVRNIVKKPTFDCKNIVRVLPFAVPKSSINLLFWLENFYPYDYGEMANLFIPPNLKVTPRQPKSTTKRPETISLPNKNADQAQALKMIEQNKHVLLHGKTGSGKTRVFVEFANQVLASGKSVLLLTPEIGLTTQLIKTIEQHCPYPVYVTHSNKTPAKRRLVWEAALNNQQPAIFIGPRSSLFLPFSKLGLVVADEAHDQSYKNMQAPRYNGLYVASKLAKLHSATFVQSTATPNVADYIIAERMNVPIVKMNTIAAGQQESSGVMIDLSDKKQFTVNKYLSDTLIEAVNKALNANQQSLLFLNRRGSARVVQCNNCGHIEECPNCGIPATYHHDNYKLSCHQCGYNQPAKNQCSECGSTDLLFFSPGTKGLEQEIIKLFPSAKVARFDLDVIQKDSLSERIAEIKAGDIDIIVGTQIITKGLDLPKLSVVGVLNADTALQLPDYRAEELAFQQLYQVTGRVGRGHSKSTFILQSRQPNHPVMEAAVKRNWDEFHKYESFKRKQFGYPPFVNLALFKISKSKTSTIAASAAKFLKKLEPVKGLTILGPSPSFYEFSGGQHHWQIIIKSKSRAAILEAAGLAPSDWSVDIDPINLL